MMIVVMTTVIGIRRNPRKFPAHEKQRSRWWNVVMETNVLVPLGGMRSSFIMGIGMEKNQQSADTSMCWGCNDRNGLQPAGKWRPYRRRRTDADVDYKKLC